MTDTTSKMNVDSIAPQDSQQNAAPMASTGDAKPLDPALLHKMSNLQQENQELLSTRRELESRLAEAEKKITAVTESYEKERAALVEKQRTEMQEQFEKFMKNWVEGMRGENADTTCRMETGITQLINEGKNKDAVWEILCTASQLHKSNVNTIEELTKTNAMLSDKNKELETIAREQSGFADPNSRMTKRAREPEPAVPPVVDAGNNQPIEASDVWGSFEAMMRASNNRAY